MFSPRNTTPLPIPAQSAHRGVGHGDWFELPALAASVATARSRVASRLGHWGLREDVRDTARLVVSELVTNAITHTDSHVVTCRLDATGQRVRIEVADEGRGLGRRAAPRPPHADSEHGRGLLLLDLVTARWGVISPDPRSGCTVWAELLP